MAENNKSVQKENVLERFGLGLAAWSEKWFPDAWVFALVGVVVVFIIGLLIGESPQKLAIEGGKAFWVLIPFTMQMAFIIIGGYVVASTPAAYWVIRKVAGITTNPRTAIAWIAFFSMITSLISWGLSLVFSALLVREMSRSIKGMDFRAAGAAAYLGLFISSAAWTLPRRACSDSSAPLDVAAKTASNCLIASAGRLSFNKARP